MDREKPQLTAQGTPKVRAMWLPAEQATVVDTWATIGMRGTGSQDFFVNDAFVPSAHTCFLGDQPLVAGPLYNSRTFFAIACIPAVANALGIPRGAIDTFVEMAGENTTSSATVLRDRLFVQARLAEAEAILSAARAYVIDAAGKFWDAIEEGRSDITYDLAQVRLAIVHAMHEAVRSVDLVFMMRGRMRSTAAIHWSDNFAISTSPFSTTAPFLHNTSQPAKY